MNALLIIVIISLQDDGSVTRQRQMIAKDSMPACMVEAHKRLEEFKRAESLLTGHVDIRCEPMATIEVVKPAPPKPAVPAPTDGTGRTS